MEKLFIYTGVKKMIGIDDEARYDAVWVEAEVMQKKDDKVLVMCCDSGLCGWVCRYKTYPTMRWDTPGFAAVELEDITEPEFIGIK